MNPILTLGYQTHRVLAILAMSLFLLFGHMPYLAVAQDLQTPVFEDPAIQQRFELIKAKNQATFNDALTSQLAWRHLEQEPPLFTRESLLEPPKVLGVRMSPNGKHLVYMLEEKLGKSLWIMEIAQGTVKKRLLAKMDRLLGWSSDSKFVFFSAANAVAVLPIDAGDAIFIAKLKDELKGKFQGIDPGSPHHIFLSKVDEEQAFCLWRVSAQGEATLVYKTKSPFQAFLTSRDGALAFFRRAEEDQQVLYRVQGQQLLELARFHFFDPAVLLAWDENRQRLLLRARMDRDLVQLWELDLQTGEAESLHRDPLAYRDMERAHVSLNRQKPILLRYTVHEGSHYFGGDPEIQKQVARLEMLLPESVLFLSPNLETGRWLVQEKRTDFPHSRYYLFDTHDGSLKEILKQEVGKHSSEPHFRLKTPFSYKTGDDFQLFGFVTLPANKDLRHCPVVVMPHGGPFARANARFDYIVQFMVNRGAIVIEPNFRASRGYGLNYILASNRDFGHGLVQQDILDSVYYILSLGLGDASRMAIFGHSFGGFSTLVGLSFTPELFQVGIAGAAPPDLVDTFAFMDRDQDMGQGITRDFAIKNHVVDLYDPTDVARLAAISPANHGHSITKPLLLLAGKRDRQVSFLQVQNYALKLEHLGKKPSLFMGDRVGHSFRRPLEKRAYLFLLEIMLSKYLDMPSQPLTDPKLRRFLDSQLVMDHHGLMEASSRP